MVAGQVQFRDRWLIDPEALLLLTLDVGRYDPRLFDEVMDWCVLNGRWLSVQRLKNIADEEAADGVRNVLRAFAAFMSGSDTGPRWRTLAAVPEVPAGQSIPLFSSPDGTPLPVVGAPDPTFARFGLLRPPIAIRRMSRPVATDYPTNLLFKLRALFGLGTRPEVVAYLLTHPAGYPSGVATSIRYTPPPVQDVMDELALSGLAMVRQTGREKLYSLDLKRWTPFLRLMGRLPKFVGWPPAFAGLSSIMHFLTEAPLETLSDYMLQSQARTLAEALRQHFAAAGIPTRFAVEPRAVAYARSFEAAVRDLLSVLNRRPTTPPTLGPVKPFADATG